VIKMVIGALFDANLNADNIYIEMTYLPDTMKNTFWLYVLNQSLSTLYFKITCNISNWSLNTPSDGKLGSINAGLYKTFTPIIERSKPVSEITDTGNLKIEAYTDSDYLNKIGEDELTVTIYIEDLENWESVQKWDFDDGQADGWTGTALQITNDESVDVGGYSARTRVTDMQEVGTDCHIQRSISIPNKNKVRISIFFAYYLKSGDLLPSYLKKPNIQVNGNKVHDIPFTFVSVPKNQTATAGWFKMCADISAYKNQTLTIKITFDEYFASRWYGELKLWRDRIVVSGKD